MSWGFQSEAIWASWICLWALRYYSKYQPSETEICILKINLHFYSCVFVCVCYMGAGACGGRKRMLYCLELESQVVVSCQMWVMGTDLEPFGRAVSAFSYQATAPVPITKILMWLSSITKCELSHGRVVSEAGFSETSRYHSVWDQTPVHGVW